MEQIVVWSTACCASRSMKCPFAKFCSRRPALWASGGASPLSSVLCAIVWSEQFADEAHEMNDRKEMTRFALSREMISVDVFDRPVAVKVGYLGTDVVNVYPEYEHCKVPSELRGVDDLMLQCSLRGMANDPRRRSRSRRSCRCSRSSRACSSSPARRWTRSAKPRPRSGAAARFGAPTAAIGDRLHLLHTYNTMPSSDHLKRSAGLLTRISRNVLFQMRQYTVCLY
jgi:hypothetical protein